MENESSQDKYLEKKLEEMGKKAHLPRISVPDFALIGAIALFLVGSGVIWVLYPSKASYLKWINQNKNSETEDAIMISEEIKESLKDKSLQAVDPSQFEEISDEDVEYIDSVNKTASLDDDSLENIIKEPTMIIEEISPIEIDTTELESTPLDEKENIAEFIDQGSLETGPKKSELQKMDSNKVEEDISPPQDEPEQSNPAPEIQPSVGDVAPDPIQPNP